VLLGEVQTILCLVFGSDDVVYTGTLSGDIYQWKGYNLESVIKSAHNGAIHSMHNSAEGFAAGGKDSRVTLWNEDFTPVTAIDLSHSSVGYKGYHLCTDNSIVDN
jgi:WD40 repeat protein